MLKKLFLLISLSIITTEIYATEDLYSPSREIQLPPFQNEQIKSDLPANHIYLENDKTLWIAGQKSLWRWNIVENTLKKIPLLEQEKSNDKLIKVVSHENKLYILSKKSVFQLNFDPLKAVKLQSKNAMQFSIDITVGKQGVYWITNNQIYLVDHNERELKTLKYPVSISSKDKIYFLPDDKKMWQIKDNGIILHNFNGNYESKVLKRTKSTIRNFSISGSDLFISTKYSVLHYSEKGDLVDSIPVENNRKLILMEQNESKHLYLFSDKLLEVYDMNSQKVYRYSLQLGRVSKAYDISSNKSIVAILLDGIPRIFQLSGDW